MERVVPFGGGLQVAAYRHGGGPPYPLEWVHAPIPLVAAWEIAPLVWPGSHTLIITELDERVQLVQVSVAFDTSASPDLHVTNLHVWNGGERIANFDNLDERGSFLTHSFDPPLDLEGWAGLNLSIGVEFPITYNDEPGDPPPPPAPAIIFSGAYAFLTVQGV
jgi:hypothetical protein